MAMHDSSTKRPNLERYSDTPIFNTKAAAAHTGVPGPTLRAWERRYELITPTRAGNTYRLYSERDIALIRWLKERVNEGMSISQAISLFRHLSVEHNTVRPPAPLQEEVELNMRARSTAEDSSVRNTSAGGSHTEPARFSTLTREQEQLLSASRLLTIRDHLIDIFTSLDEAAANMAMGSLLTVYSVEQICMELIAPMLWQIGLLWSESKITVTTEHFASNFFRALLTNLFHVTPGPREGPSVFICCAPGESHEIAALMIAIFLRRRNNRVVYLGQSIEVASLLRTIEALSPTMICVSLTMLAHLPALVSLSYQVQQLPPPRPLFVFGGQVFAHYPDIISQVDGMYMDSNLIEVANRLHGILLECSKNQNLFSENR